GREVVEDGQRCAEVVVGSDEGSDRSSLAGRTRGLELEGFDGNVTAFHLDRTELTEREPITDRVDDALSDDDAPGLRERLKASGDVNGITERDGRFVPASDRTDRDATGVHTDTHVQVLDAPRVTHLLRERRDHLLDLEGGPRRADRIVLARTQQSEEGSDA